MNIFIAGQNPASLYASILLRKARPDWQVVVSEQDTRAALPADILTNPVKPQMRLRDVDVAAAIAAITVDIHRVDVSRSSSAGHDIRQIEGLAYRTISASELHNALRQEALRAGCVFASAAPENPDLVLVGDCNKLGGLGADAASLLMPLPAGSRAHVQFRVNANAGALAFGFHDTGRGVISAVLIPDSACSSSLILEGTPEAITATGPDVHAFCKTAFADLIGGAEFEMLSREPRPVQLAGKWHAGHIALIGAAASQPHYSIGLAARSGFEDAEALVDALLDHSSVPEALAAWQALRFPKAESLHRAADSSANWLAHVHQVYDMPMSRFAFACITRSLRLTYTHVKHAAPAFTREVDAIVAGPATGSANVPPPPMFTPYSMRGLTIPNRMSFSPMCMYSAHEGAVSDFQLVHLGARAVGGFGLVFAEMTNVTAQGRMTHHCAGMYSPEHVPAFKRITDYVHEHTEAKIAIQLAHAGRKGSISRSWEKDVPLAPEDEWETIAPSPIAYQQGRPLPREMTLKDIQDVTDAFAKAARMSEEAGFDMIEIHAAHGYLLSSFISPLSNRRTDAYGGSLQNRMRFPLEVFEAIRANFPAEKPISVRISASDWRSDGIQPRDAIEFSKMFHERGADIIAVSSSGVTPERRPAVVERLYQLAFSDAIHNEGKVPTMTVGGVLSHGDCNTIIASGRADICLMARGALNDPYFPQHAAREQGHRIPWTFPYARAAETPVRAG